MTVFALTATAGASAPPSSSAVTGQPARPTSSPASSKGDQPRPFAHGVSIDWPNRTVEVQGKVVLREGPLELLACSPRTREHESIIMVNARPMHIFQALGLIGLEPGAAMRFDEKSDTWSPPRGQALDLRIRYRAKTGERIVPATAWLRDVKTKQPPRSIPWVFAGSEILEDGRFAADPEGTVVCVVDFFSALIAVGTLHSADNELLWLEANSDAVPPLGTECTLLIRAAGKGKAEAPAGGKGDARGAARSPETNDRNGPEPPKKDGG